METKDNKINNCIYASFYHLELIILPIIIRYIEEDKKSIEIITEYKLKNTISDILQRLNLSDEKLESLKKIKWNNKKHQDLENQKIFIVGSKKFIEEWNLKLKGKDICNCYHFEDIDNGINIATNNLINTTSIY